MKTNLATAWLLALATAAGAGPAAAEEIYRCGDSYSQKPCPGGKLVQVEDARSASQKSQTDQAARRDAHAADAMEKARLKEEAKPAPVGMPLPRPDEASKEGANTVAGAKKAKKPVHFTAVSPRQPGDKAAKKKKVAKPRAD